MATSKPSIARKAASFLRREPSQARAQATMETLYEATAQIVEQEGLEALSTNKIAAKAGFSIGTLYQYFPTKEAILAAIIDRERSRVRQGLHDLLTDAQAREQPPQEVLRAYIRQLIEGFGSGRGSSLYRKAARAMIRVAWQMDYQEHILAQVRETSDRIAVYLAHADQHGAQRLHVSPVTLFVVTRAVVGVVRCASLERSPLLGLPEFEDELVRLAWRMLAKE
ncbi:TetR/AcrR family transcriptional regulator [Variovorax sp. PCZ-1]|uniref:TetR/AcrR family transcriptional regulator n=1 Tax=Variovorax sp. PCZ-1 TaxID=2835533 RepID=UPI001BCC95A7|nr:TetR/AcrR family transcriptional regulator [Variovorax sp. PCZ-1]MBS7807728.1 TetR/AcrR family transcriptional regulator [Variovorax sp. PCZ-1]